MGIGKVIQMLNGLPDALLQAIADGRRAVDGSGDCGNGDLRKGGDGANIGCLGGCLARSFSNHEQVLTRMG